MRLLLIALSLTPACTGYLARVRDHFEKKFKKPECHLEWEDVYRHLIVFYSMFLTEQMTAAAEYLQLQYLARGIAALVIF